MFTLAERCALDVIVGICAWNALGGGHDAMRRAMWGEVLDEALAAAPRIAAPKGPDQVALRSIIAHARDLCNALQSEAKGGAYARTSYELRNALHTLFEYRAGLAFNDMLIAVKGGRHA